MYTDKLFVLRILQSEVKSSFALRRIEEIMLWHLELIFFPGKANSLANYLGKNSIGYQIKPVDIKVPVELKEKEVMRLDEGELSFDGMLQAVWIYLTTRQFLVGYAREERGRFALHSQDYSAG